MPTLAEVMTPFNGTPLGGYMAGTGFADYRAQQAAEAQKSQLEMALKQAEEQRKAQMHPLEMEGKQNANLQTIADTAYRKQATETGEFDLSQKRAKAPFELQETENKARQSALTFDAERDKMFKNNLIAASEAARQGGKLAALQVFGDNLPPAFANILRNIPDNQVPNFLRTIHDTYVKASEGYQKELLQRSTQKEIAAMQIASAERRAAMKVAPSDFASRAEKEITATRGKPFEQYTVLVRLATEASLSEDPEIKKLASKYSQMATSIQANARSAVNQNNPGGKPAVQNGQIIYNENPLSAPFPATNPFNPNQPPKREIKSFFSD